MGNASSSSIKTNYTQSELMTSTADKKVPKHLQPLKRKHTHKKKVESSPAAVTAAPPRVHEENRVPATISNHHIDTLIPNHFYNASNDINQIFIDHSASSPQLFRWTKGRRFACSQVKSQNTMDMIMSTD